MKQAEPGQPPGLEQTARDGIGANLPQNAGRHALPIGGEVRLHGRFQAGQHAGSRLPTQTLDEIGLESGKPALEITQRARLRRTSPERFRSACSERTRSRTQPVRALERGREAREGGAGVDPVLRAQVQGALPALARDIDLGSTVSQAADLAIASPGMRVAVQGVRDAAQNDA